MAAIFDVDVDFRAFFWSCPNGSDSTCLDATYHIYIYIYIYDNEAYIRSRFEFYYIFSCSEWFCILVWIVKHLQCPRGFLLHLYLCSTSLWRKHRLTVYRRPQVRGLLTESMFKGKMPRYLSHLKWNESLSKNAPRNLRVFEDWKFENRGSYGLKRGRGFNFGHFRVSFCRFCETCELSQNRLTSIVYHFKLHAK